MSTAIPRICSVAAAAIAAIGCSGGKRATPAGGAADARVHADANADADADAGAATDAGVLRDEDVVDTKGEVLSAADFDSITVDRGEPHVVLFYPDLARLPPALAAELTTRMRRYLHLGGAGVYEGDCHVGLIAPEVVSVSCRRDKPGGFAHVGFTYWRVGGLPTIDPAELVGGERLKNLCGDAARPSIVLDRDGLRWRPDLNHAAPDDCPDGVEWGDMAPASARARALVARMLASAE